VALSAPQFLGRQSRGAVLSQRDIEEWRKQLEIFHRVELDLRQRAYEISEAPLRRYIDAAESLTAPFGDWVQRRVSAGAGSGSTRPKYALRASPFLRRGGASLNRA
jgi:hypothetical protein